MTGTKPLAWALRALLVLALSGCSQEPANKADADPAGPPQIASLDDYDVPVDKSAEITTIDAATGDASGMPRDGGGAVTLPKAASRAAEDKPAQPTPLAASTPPAAPVTPTPTSEETVPQ